MIYFLKQHLFTFLTILIVFIPNTYSRKWSIEELLNNVHEWNYLNDPEELISDKNLGPKIHTSYLKINHVYEKTDINLFYLSDVVEKYVYKRRLFVEDLYEAMLDSKEINKANMKKHHLFLVLFKKYNELIIFGSSPELVKLLPSEKVLNIEMEIKKAMGNKKNNPATVIFLIFDKLQHMWKKYTINATKKNNNSNKTNITDIIYLGGSITILSLFFYTLCIRKKKNKID